MWSIVTFRTFFLFLVDVVALVESNSRPVGHQLVSTYMTNRNADPMDLVELARQVQKVRNDMHPVIVYTDKYTLYIFPDKALFFFSTKCMSIFSYFSTKI